MHNVYKQRDHQSVIPLSEFNLSQRYYLQVADVTHYKMAVFVYLWTFYTPLKTSNFDTCCVLAI